MTNARQENATLAAFDRHLPDQFVEAFVVDPTAMRTETDFERSTLLETAIEIAFEMIDVGRCRWMP